MQQLTREQILSIYNSGSDAVIGLIELLYSELSKQQDRIKALEDQLSKDSHNSHKPPSSDLPKKLHRTKSLRKSTGKKRGGQVGHKGVTLKMVPQADHIILHQVTCCKSCKRSLKKAKVLEYEKRQVFDLPKLEFEVTEHQAEVKECPGCEKLNCATFPDHVSNVVQYGQRIKTLAVYLKNYQLLPYARTSEFFKDLFSQPVSVGTLVNFNQECFDALADYNQAVKEKLTASKVACFDETSLKVNGQRNWLHSTSTADLTFYQRHQKRGQEAMNAIGILPNFNGRAVHDFLGAYLKYDCMHGLCNVHHLRDLTFIYEQHDQKWAQKMIDLLIETKNKVEQNKKWLNQKTLAACRRRYRNILKKGLLENPAPETSLQPKKRGRKKKTKSLNLLERFAQYSEEILAFAFDFNVPFDNNLAERDLRMMKVQQKISGAFRSNDGADSFCRIRGYISTNRKQGINVLQAIHNDFEHNAIIPLK